MFICIVVWGRTHGVLLWLFKCRVIKIINCCSDKCGCSRPLPWPWAGRGTRPTRHRFRAAAGADADLRKSAPRIANGPRFATPGAGSIAKEQIHAQSIQIRVNSAQRALYPHNTRRISPHLRAVRIYAASPFARCIFGICWPACFKRRLWNCAALVPARALPLPVPRSLLARNQEQAAWGFGQERPTRAPGAGSVLDAVLRSADNNGPVPQLEFLS
jgi:hypothetical protein